MPDVLPLPLPSVDLRGRYDLYGPVHKALRRALSDLLVRLGTADFANLIASAALLTDLRSQLALGASHLAHEEAYVHRALEARVPGAVARLDHQHAEHQTRFAELERLITALQTAAPAERPRLGRSLYLAFSLFVAEDLAHMHEEETVTWPLLCEHFSDAELTTIEAEIVASQAPEEMMAWMRLILPAISRTERAGLLGGMRAAAPPEVFAAVIEQAARPTLSPDDYADLAARLGLDA